MPVDERTFVADVAAWVTAILERRTDLPYGRARVEEHGVGDRKRHDFVLYRRGLPRVALTGEVKMPDSPQGRSPLDQALVEDAFEKASRRGTPYYFTWNVREFALFQTHQEGVPFMDRRIEGPTTVAQVATSDDVRRPEVESAIVAFWEKFLEDFARLEAGRRPLLNLPLDRRFILRLEDALLEPISLTESELARRYREDKRFKADLGQWMVDQGWELSEAEEVLRANLERAARLSCYILVTRLVFYQVLRRRFRVLAPLGGMVSASPDELGEALKARFQEAVSYSRDYETIFPESDFGSSLPLVHPEAHRAWLAVIDSIEDFDFSRLDYEVIGQLYERLIGPGEGQKYGQYYTKPNVVDLINAFCIRDAHARVLDPACGGGTFLVRAYARKRTLAQSRQVGTPTHQQLLQELYGVDVNTFPAQLATINLAIRHLSDEANYPQVSRADFFNPPAGNPVYRFPNAGDAEGDLTLADLDAVVGNPPYIRQERLSESHKHWLPRIYHQDWPGQTPLSGRSDIYAHFFAHAASLLRPGGYLGFVTSIGWLDTDYGFRLQELFLRNFRIIAVLESQVEKWFEDARVTTAVTILQREPDERRRMANPVRFIQLRKPLAEIYSEALRAPVSEESEAARQVDMDAVRDLIEEIRNDQTTEYWRVRVRTQAALWEAGCRARLGPENEATGAAYKAGKWGQYVRAPDVWFDILEIAGERLVPLHELAEVRFGFKTGADRFFCVRDVTEEQLRLLPDAAAFRAKWGVAPGDTERVRIVRDGEGGLHLVEARFLEPEFHTLMEAQSIVVRASDCQRRVVNAPVSRATLRRTRLGDYVAYAEQRGWHTGSTVASRARVRPWYDLGLRPKAERAHMFWPKSQQYRHIVAWNEERLPGNDNLYDVWANEDVRPRLLWAVLNSTVVALSKHQFGRAAGVEGNLKTEVVDVNMMLVPDVRRAPPEVAALAVAAAERMAKRASRNLPEEFVLDDRQDLDDAVLGFLGVADPAERRELRGRIYEALSQLYAATRARELIAQKDRLHSKRKGALTAADMADELWELERDSFKLLQFPEDFLRRPPHGQPLDLPPGPVEVGTAMIDTGRRLRAGTIRVGGPKGEVMDVGSVARGFYAATMALCGHSGPIPMPEDADCESAVQEFARYRTKLEQQLKALATERTRDTRKQRAIAEALMRRALAWRPALDAKDNPPNWKTP
ncbi:MAG: SAM-dependent DNA methyltransferase [Chloroflexi bacterium]|nr:SAM-dependent DNA methyltransferase [Chloroflexota bacterium]